MWHVVATLPWIVAVLVARSSIGDNSFLWHVTAGRLQSEGGSVLTEDPFSTLRMGAPWRTQSWLADVGYSWLDNLVGLDFVPWLRFGAAAVLFLIVAFTVARVSGSIAVVASVSFLTALLAVPYLNPRPVLFSYVLLALVVLVERSPQLRWTLPLIFYTWASLHGSWVIGAGYLALSVLEQRDYRRIRSEAPWIAATTLLTAHGWGVVDYLLAFSRNSEALSLITEWGPPDLLSVARLPFTAALLIIMLGAARGGLGTRDVGFSIPIILFALSSSRSVFPAFLMLVPVLARALASLLVGTFQRPLAGVRWVLAAVFLLPLLLPVTGGLNENRFPVDLIGQAKGSKVFHDDVIGGYLIYASWPDTPVLIDDRAELFGEELGRFVSVRSGKDGWDEYFDEFGFERAIVQGGHALESLLLSAGWTEVGTGGDSDQWTLLARPSN